MKTMLWRYLVIAFTFSNACLGLAGETGMSYDGTNDPNAPKPQFAPPGAGNPPKPITTNTTPVTGVAPQTSGTPQPEVQPGTETPQVEEQKPVAGTLHPPLGGVVEDKDSGAGGGNGGYEGGSGGGNEGGSGGGNEGGGGSSGNGSGGGDGPLRPKKFDDWDRGNAPTTGGSSGGGVGINASVRGIDTPLTTGQGPETGPGDPQSGQAAPPQNPLNNQSSGSNTGTLPTKNSSLPTMPTPGGHTSQSGADLMPDKNAGSRQLEGLGTTPPTSAPAAQGKLTKPALAPDVTGSGTIVIPRKSCGTFWTGYVDDPNVDVNPCPTNCERGERQTLNSRKEGDKLKYQARYQCYLPALTVSKQIAGVTPQTAGSKPRLRCGTFWTGWHNDLNATVNPCPKGCEPGELQLVNRSLSGSTVQYDKRYLCYKIEQSDMQSSSMTPSSTAQSAASNTKTPLPVALEDGKPVGEPKLLPPSVVTGFSAISTGPDRIELSWNPVSTVTNYRLARKDLGGSIHIFTISAATNPKSYTDTGLRPSTYKYTIFPINSAGENSLDPATASATVARTCNPAAVSLRSTSGKERCFGAVGMQCAGGRMGTKKDNAIAEAAAPPGVINSDCTITQDVAVGSIMHDNCCVTHNGNGAYCSGEAPGTDELDPVCMREWRKAVWNKIDGRTWKHTFGPYLSDDQGDQLGTTTARPATTNGILGFRDDPQPWPGPERYATSQLKAPLGTALDIDSAAYCESGRFSMTDWKGPLLTKGSDYAKWIADKQKEIDGRDAWINKKIAEKDDAWNHGDLIKVASLEAEINGARLQNTAARADLAKLVALRDAQYLARVTEWGVCQ